MSSDNDLFGSDTDESGNDTDDLINTARSQAPVKKKLGAAAKKKSSGGGRLQKKGSSSGSKKVPDADNDDSDDDDSLDGGGASGKPMSKKEKMEALAKARRGDSTDGDGGGGTEKSERRQKRSGGEKGSGGAGDGYPSDAESVDSAEFQRTKEDDDFIDASGEDPEALRELYREQHFDDEEAEEDDMEERPRASIGGGKRGKRKVNWNPDSDIRRSASKTKKDADGNEVEPDNPIMAAVHKMKKKKKEVKKLSDLEEESKDIVMQMLEAADEDDKAIEERRPALHKLQYLNKLLDVMALKEMSRPLLDNDFLAAAGRWIQPLKNGKLGNVTIRHQMLHGIQQHFSGGNEKGIKSQDLKRSGFGKVCMSLYMHPNETPELKRFLKQLIEQWSRPIFAKSGNMKDLEKAQRNRQYMMPQQQQQQHMSQSPQQAAAADAPGNRSVVGLSTILAKGKSSTGTGGGARVRVPYSRGFQFTVRPEAKTSITEDVVKTAKQNSTITERREGLNKRMVDKGRFKTSGKSMRSANISVEGRRMK